ncbi:zeta-carotene isomerase [Ranunculus cassubicifolius]
MANPGVRSFAQIAAAKEEVAPPLRVVEMEGLEFSPALVTGQLLGLDVGSVLQVTNCFPFPTRDDDEELEADGANYQLEMMRCLREVNVDNNTVGWLSIFDVKAGIALNATLSSLCRGMTTNGATALRRF